MLMGSIGTCWGGGELVVFNDGPSVRIRRFEGACGLMRVAMDYVVLGS